jgi:hypothetical protein
VLLSGCRTSHAKFQARKISRLLQEKGEGWDERKQRDLEWLLQ